MSVIEDIFGLFAAKGDCRYGHEAVSQTEHALQAAALAEAQHAPDSLVLAALLHDVGHLLANASLHARTSHERVGQAWLARFLGPEVTEPVRLHVDAKRYLCAVDPSYRSNLSPASLRSLEIQGGSFKRSEAREFQENPYHREAVWLRHIDDRAKQKDLVVPGFAHYAERLETAVLKRHLDGALNVRAAASCY